MDRQYTVLIVEDDDNLREVLVSEFIDKSYNVIGARNLSELSKANNKKIDFAIVDLKIGTESGLDAITIILKNHPTCKVFMATGYGTIATAVEAMKLGASGYLTKPFEISELEAKFFGEYDIKMKGDSLKRESLDQHEREYIEYVLVKCDGNISKAARWLKIHRQSLQRKLKKYSTKQD